MLSRVRALRAGGHGVVAAGAAWSARIAVAFAYDVEFTAKQALRTTPLRVDVLSLNAEYRVQCIALRAACEHQFRDLICSGIAADKFCSAHPRPASFALPCIAQTVGRWHWPDGPMSGRIPVDDVEELHGKLEQIGVHRVKGTLPMATPTHCGRCRAWLRWSHV